MNDYMLWFNRIELMLGGRVARRGPVNLLLPKFISRRAAFSE